jgi:hypothetical protein
MKGTDIVKSFHKVCCESPGLSHKDFVRLSECQWLRLRFAGSKEPCLFRERVQTLKVWSASRE